MTDKIELDAAGIEAALAAYADCLPFGLRDGAKGAEALRAAIADAITAYLSASKAVPEAPVAWHWWATDASSTWPAWSLGPARPPNAPGAIPLFASPPKTYEDGLREAADAAYVHYISLMQSKPCLGVEAKLADGSFGLVELKAHCEAAEYLGRHRALSALIGAQK